MSVSTVLLRKQEIERNLERQREERNKILSKLFFQKKQQQLYPSVDFINGVTEDDLINFQPTTQLDPTFVNQELQRNIMRITQNTLFTKQTVDLLTSRLPTDALDFLNKNWKQFLMVVRKINSSSGIDHIGLARIIENFVSKAYFNYNAINSSVPSVSYAVADGPSDIRDEGKTYVYDTTEGVQMDSLDQKPDQKQDPQDYVMKNLTFLQQDPNVLRKKLKTIDILNNEMDRLQNLLKDNNLFEKDEIIDHLSHFDTVAQDYSKFKKDDKLQIYFKLLRYTREKYEKAVQDYAEREKAGKAVKVNDGYEPDNEEYNQEELAQEEPAQKEEAQISGNGIFKLKKKKRVGFMGGSADLQTNIKSKYYVDLKSLNSNILKLKYKNFSSPVPKFPSVKISDECKETIKLIISNRPVDANKYFSKLSPQDKKLVVKFCSIAGCEIITEIQESKESLFTKYKVLSGEINAGNDNPIIKQMLIDVIEELFDLQYITKHQYLDIKSMI